MMISTITGLNDDFIPGYVIITSLQIHNLRYSQDPSAHDMTNYFTYIKPVIAYYIIYCC